MPNQKMHSLSKATWQTSVDGERGTGRYIRLYDDQFNPSRTGNRQKYRYVFNGIPTFCIFTRTPEYLLV